MSLYVIDGGGEVEHLAEEGGEAFCGTKPKVLGWLFSPDDPIASEEQLAGRRICARCKRIAFKKKGARYALTPEQENYRRRLAAELENPRSQ